MAGNSTITLQMLVDDAASLGDTAPALPVGGAVDGPAISMANDVLTAMLQGGPNGEPFNWKWNRINVAPFVTISWQQDYFIPNLVNLGWLESAWAVNINQPSNPKQKVPVEVKRDLMVTYLQTGYPGKLCWIPNNIAQTGSWGQHPLGPTASNPSGEVNVAGVNPSGMQNPGPNVIYTNPLGAVNTPANATTAIADANGNLWVLTTFGTCGATIPTFPSNPTFPTPALPNTVATTVADGTCVWTAVNPNGQALRISPIPPQSGIVWQIQPVAQKRVALFSSLTQTLDPVPDDFSSYFKQGFFTQCYRRSPDSKVRAKFEQEYGLWLKALDKAVRQGNREMDDEGFVPSTSIMDSGQGMYVGPAYPWPNAFGS